MVRHIPLISYHSPTPTSQKHKSSATNWNLIVSVIGIFSFNLDPFFLYLPKNCGSTSICMDVKLGAIVAILRTVSDASFLCGKYLLPNKSPTHEASSKGLQHVKEPKNIVGNHLILNIMIYLASLLPLPQILIWHKIQTSDMSMSFNSSITISRVILLQFSFRAIAMVPVSNDKFKTTSILMKNAWTGALLNLMYFMVLSHTWGALYYEMYIAKLLECKHIVSLEDIDATTLDWDQLLGVCTKHDKFEIGMLSEAFATKIAMRSFAQKYVFCLSWGLKSLSSFGQIFSASSYAVDTFFSFLTVVFGLILFGDLLARMQSGLQSTEIREDGQRKRQRMVEEWMHYHQLPQRLKRQVKQAVQSEWSATRGMNDEAILSSLPWDVRCQVRRHLYLDIIHILPPFAEMDDFLVKEVCGHLRTFSSNEGTYITFEDEPVRQMIFIYSGELEVSHANNGRHSVTRGPGEFCGEELLEWCTFPTRSTENLPSSTQTVKCVTDVDAFSLAADDVKLLAIQFHRDGKFRQAFQRYVA